MIKNKEKGQALLMLLLVLSVVLTIIIATVSRSVTDIKITTYEDNSARAFGAAEAGVEEALPNLPATGPVATNSGATQAAANTLLAKLYLNKAVYKSARPEGPYQFDAADMDKVIQYCDAIEAAGYDLETEYFTNFGTGASKEIIFTSAEGTPQNRWFMTLHYNQNPSGWNGFTTLADFYAKFEDGDQRTGNYPAPDGSAARALSRARPWPR
jgi:hypothetical protein